MVKATMRHLLETWMETKLKQLLCSFEYAYNKAFKRDSQRVANLVQILASVFSVVN